MSKATPKMKWSDAVRIMAINSLYELKNDLECRCEAGRPDPCWNCKTHAALKMAVKKKVIYMDIPPVEKPALAKATGEEGA